MLLLQLCTVPCTLAVTPATELQLVLVGNQLRIVARLVPPPPPSSCFSLQQKTGKTDPDQSFPEPERLGEGALLPLEAGVSRTAAATGTSLDQSVNTNPDQIKELPAQQDREFHYQEPLLGKVVRKSSWVDFD